MLSAILVNKIRHDKKSRILRKGAVPGMSWRQFAIFSSWKWLLFQSLFDDSVNDTQKLFMIITKSRQAEREGKKWSLIWQHYILYFQPSIYDIAAQATVLVYARLAMVWSFCNVPREACSYIVVQFSVDSHLMPISTLLLLYFVAWYFLKSCFIAWGGLTV